MRGKHPLGCGVGSQHACLGRIPNLVNQATLYEAKEPIVWRVGGLFYRQKTLNVFPVVHFEFVFGR